MKTPDSLDLVWNEFQSSSVRYLTGLKDSGDFCDVTLVCEDGEPITVHRVVLAAGSGYFQHILRRAGSHPHPLLVMKGIRMHQLEALVTFLYKGETSVLKKSLDSFLKLARDFEVKGLAEEDNLHESVPDNVIEQEDETMIALDDIKEEPNIPDDHVANKEENSYSDVNQINHSDLILNDIGKQDLEELRLKRRYNKKIPSPVWKFATRQDNEIIKCNLCQIILQCKGGSTKSMLYHFRHFHSDNVEVLRNISKDKQTNTTRKQIPSPVWKFATRQEDDNVMCNLCQRILRCPDGSTKGILFHLSGFHSDNEDVVSHIEKVKQKRELAKLDSNRRILQTQPNCIIQPMKKSTILKFFYQIESNHFECNMCDKKLSKKANLNSALQSMRYHLKKRHSENPDVRDAFDSDSKEIDGTKDIKCVSIHQQFKDDEQNDEKNKSFHRERDLEMWQYFERDQMNMYAKCKYCLYKVFKINDGVLTNMEQHMNARHFDVMKNHVF